MMDDEAMGLRMGMSAPLFLALCFHLVLAFPRGHLRSQLDDAVISFDHLDLSPRLIQVMATPKVGRQDNLSPTSNTDK